MYSKEKADRVRLGFGIEEFDNEGRYVELSFKNFILISVYFLQEVPRMNVNKLSSVSWRYSCLTFVNSKENRKEILVCGDVNIAHKEIDIKNWKGNLKNSGFLPEERAWMTNLFDNEGWFDIFRKLDKRPEQYTWWSNRGQARAKRTLAGALTIRLALPSSAMRLQTPRFIRKKRFSDHAPLIIDYLFSPEHES